MRLLNAEGDEARLRQAQSPFAQVWAAYLLEALFEHHQVRENRPI
jgi:hypothetical protein